MHVCEVCVVKRNSGRYTRDSSQLQAMRWHGAAVGAHLTTPVIILIFNQKPVYTHFSAQPEAVTHGKLSSLLWEGCLGRNQRVCGQRGNTV